MGTTSVPPPTTGNAVVLNSSGGTSPPSYYNLGSLQFQSIVFNATGIDPYYGIVSSQPSDIIGLQSGGYIQTADAIVTINTGLTLNGPATISVLTSFGGISFAPPTNLAGPSQAQPITGTGGLTLVNNGNNGALQISSVNTYTGGTTVNGTGTVLFNVNGAVPIGSALTVNGSASFATSSIIGSLAGTGTVAMNGGNTLTVGTDNTSTTFSGTLQDGGTGSASLAKVGTGTLTLSGVNTYSGGTLISGGGTLSVAADDNLGATAGGLTFDDGTLQMTSSSFTTSRPITLDAGGGTFTNTTGSLVTLAGNITGSGGLTTNGSGFLQLSGTNTYFGPTQVISGGLLAETPNALSSASDFTIGAGAVLEVVNQAIGSLAGAGSVAGIGTLAAGADNASTVFSGTIIDYPGAQLALNKLGTGTLTFTGDNTYSGGTTISAGTLQIGDGGTSGTISGDVVNNGTLSFNRSDTVTFGGAISGSGTVQQLGTGTLTLSGSNSYAGGTYISSSGTVSVSSDSNLGAATGAVTLDSGTLQFGGSFVSNRPFTLNSGGGAFDTNGSNVTLNGAIVGSGGLTKISPGTLTLSGMNSYTGGTTISAGTLQLGNGGNSGSIVGNVADNGTLAFDRSDVVTFNGVISGSGSVQQSGSGTTVLTGANTYSGGTLITGGTLQVAADSNLGSSAGGITFNGGTLLFTGTGTPTSTATTDRPITLDAGGGTIGSPSGGIGYVDGNISGSGSLTLNSGGWMFLEGTNTYSGPTLINSRAVFTLSSALSSSSAYTIGPNAVLYAFPEAGGSLSGTIGSLAGSGAISGFGTLSVGADNTSTQFSGVIAEYTPDGQLTLNKIGSGTLTLSGNNIYSGGTTISAGSLQLGNGGTSGSIGGNVSDGGTLAFDRSDVSTFSGVISDAGTPGAVQQLGTGTTILTGNNTFSGGTTISAGALQLGNGGTAGSIVGNVSNGGTLAFDRSDVVTFAGTISDAGTPGAVQQLGSGTTILTANNTYGGGTTITAGALQLGNGGTSGSITGNVSNGGTLIFNRSDTVTFAGTISDANTPGTVQQTGTGTTILTGNNTYSGGTTISAGTLQVGNGSTAGSITGDVTDDALLAFSRADSVNFGSAISGSGAVQQLGQGTLTLTGSNSYTGGTIINSGTLQIGSGGTSGSIAGDVLNDGTLTFNRSDATVFGGAIAGNGQLIKTGAGTLTLSGASTYTGTTDVQAGGLVVNGSLAGSNVGVENAATLAGTGTIANAVTILSGGTLAPGSSTSPGTLTVGSLTLNSGATLQYSLGTANVPGGSGNALTNVTGALTLDGTMNVTSSGNFSLGLYRLFNYGGSFQDSGLTIGTLPATYSGSIQTTIPGQVNLIVDSPGTLIQFWDGTTGSGDGTIHGGSGSWTTAGTNTNWTTPNGAINASWQGGFGIFAGTAQTVTAATPISYQGLQFSTTGYEVDGPGALTPVGMAPIRVDAGVTASITAPVTGSGGLLKSDPGTLVLTGTNTYSGGTSISAGTLQLGNGGTAGSIVGDVSNGGTLAFDRSGVATFAGTISDAGAPGAVQQLGTGSTILTGNNTYTGGTTISAGILQLGSGGTIGSITGNVSDGGTLVFDRSDTVTFAGAISDASTPGAVTQMGSGTTILTGNNTYSGGTTISGGTLQIGNGGTSGSIIGNVSNAGTLAFNRSDSLTVGGTISGTGSLEQNGSGELTLTGQNTYTGATTVNAGTLSVEGTLVSNVTVNAGGTLNGNGTTGSVILSNGGILSPGNLGNTANNTGASRGGTRSVSGLNSSPGTGNSLSTLTVNGSLTFQLGSTYLVSANAAGQSDLTEVNGKATLNGAAVQVLASNGSYNTHTTYTILSASDGVSGTFAGVATNLAFLTPTLVYQPDDVLLEFTRNDASLSSVGQNGNQTGVGGALQDASQGAVSNNGQKILGLIESLSADQARTAYESLSGEGVTAVENVALLSNDLFLSSLHDQGQTWVHESRTWGTVFGSEPRFKGDSSAGTAAQNDTIWGAAIGGDALITNDLEVGAALGGTDGTLSVSQRQTSGEVRGLHLGGYADWDLHPFYTSAELAYSHYSNVTTRTIASVGGLSGETERADFGSQALRGRIELGRTIDLAAVGTPTLSLTPYAALQGALLRSSAFTESDAQTHSPDLFGLTFEAHNTTSAPTLLGIKFQDMGILFNGLILQPNLNLAWMHELMPERNLTASLNSLPEASFTVAGAQPSRNALQFDAGAQLWISRSSFFYLNLQDVASSRFTAYSGEGGIRINW